MPSTLPRSALAIRLNQNKNYEPPAPRKLKHAPCTSQPDSSPLSDLGFSPVLPPSFLAAASQQDERERPSKRPMPTPSSTIAVVNSSGRQAASFIRVASAVGYHVRAQLRNLDGIVANEISSLPNVTVIVGDLYTPTNTASKTPGVNHALIKELFAGAHLAFINTTFWGDELAIGKALADAAAATPTMRHYIYSSMPNHSLHSPTWPSLPLWSAKEAVETYIRSLPKLAPISTFLYTGIYNNNFTSLPYPLFCMALQPDGSFLWEAPFHPDVPLPWLDAEHDVGAAVLQLVKDGTRQWAGQKIALAYEMLSPREACRKFARGVGRPVRYRRVEKIEVRVKIPAGYREQLGALERMYALGAKDKTKQPPYFGSAEFESSCPTEALALWEGPRGLEEYAREVFPLEEAANGLTWMNESPNDTESRNESRNESRQDNKEDGFEDEDGGRLVGGEGDDEEGSDDGDETASEGLVMGETPARREESWLA